MTRTCSYCGEAFESSHWKAKYCPPPRSCRSGAWNSRRRVLARLVAPVEDAPGQSVNPHPLPRPTHPKGWEPGVVWNGRDGELVSHPRESPPDNWSELLDVWDLDHELFEVVEPVQFRAWDANVGEGNVRRLYYYRATIRQRQPDAEEERKVDVAEILADIRKWKPPKRKPPAGDLAFVVNLSDWQIGKSDGDGVSGTVQRIITMIRDVRARYRELRRIGRKFGTLYIVGLGDIVEGCSENYSTQLFTVELNHRDQRKVTRRLILQAVQRWAPDFETVVILAVGGNHGEERKDGKKVTDDADNRDVAVFEDVVEIVRVTPGLEHVSAVLPDGELVVVLDVAGVAVAWTHMHQAGGGTAGLPQAKAKRWWGDQAFGRQPAGDAEILISGHYHHLSLIEHSEGRTHIQCPAMESESKWFREKTGAASRPGTLTLVVGDGGYGDLAVI